MRYLLLCWILLLTGCFKEPLYHSQSYVFGTLVDINLYGETDARAKLLTDHLLQDYQSLHHRLHAWKPMAKNRLSALGELNAAIQKGSQPIVVSAELAHILADAKHLSIQSNGLFNPAIGQLIGQWGFQQDEFKATKVDDAVIQNLVQSRPSMHDLVLKAHTVYSTNKAVKLDLGGYAKGYALDVAVAYLRQQQVKNALINIGGNIIALGQHADKPWRVGIQHPRQPTAIATLDLADGWAIGSSGDYQRYFMLNGKRYCHIIDPRTGYPAQNVQAVTVLVPPSKRAGVLSDVASKPIFIESAENRIKAAHDLGIDHFLVIDANGKIAVSAPMVQKLRWVNTGVQFTTLP